MSASGYHPVVAVFSSGTVGSELRDHVSRALDSSGVDVRIFTYAVGPDADQFELRRLACLAKGAYYDIPNDSSTLV